MSRWRVIITDSESLTGVAPECPMTATNHLVEDEDGALPDVHSVYGCCPQPHLECFSEVRARQVAHTLTYFEVELCS